MTAEQAVETAVETTAEAAPVEAQENVEAEARRQGWRPQDEYKGDPTKWKPAEEYLKVGEKLQPILHERLRKQDKQITEMQSLIRDMHANQKAEQDKAVKRAIAELQKDKRIAVSEGDIAKVDAIDAQIDEVRAAPPQRVEQPVPGPEFVEWAEENHWFKNDEEMSMAAIGAFGKLSKDPATKGLDNEEKLKRVTALIRKRFPEAFPGNPRRAEAAAVEGGGNAPRNNGGKKTWSDLPAEVRPIAERVLAQTKMTKEQYLKDYPW